jgi:hypothetical protein
LLFYPYSASSSSVSAACDIQRTQTILEALGYKPGPLDGRWGSKTANAVTQFQNNSGLLTTGMLDEQTCMHLLDKIFYSDLKDLNSLYKLLNSYRPILADTFKKWAEYLERRKNVIKNDLEKFDKTDISHENLNFVMINRINLSGELMRISEEIRESYKLKDEYENDISILEKLLLEIGLKYRNLNSMKEREEIVSLMRYKRTYFIISLRRFEFMLNILALEKKRRK